jgi:hypothetical protein
MLAVAGLMKAYNAVQDAVYKGNAHKRRTLSQYIADQKVIYDRSLYFIGCGGYYAVGNPDAMRCELLHLTAFGLEKVGREMQECHLNDEEIWRVLDYVGATLPVTEESHKRVNHKIKFELQPEMREALMECWIAEAQIMEALVHRFAAMEESIFWTGLSSREIDPAFHVRVVNALHEYQRQRHDLKPVFS